MLTLLHNSLTKSKIIIATNSEMHASLRKNGVREEKKGSPSISTVPTLHRFSLITLYNSNFF